MSWGRRGTSSPRSSQTGLRPDFKITDECSSELWLRFMDPGEHLLAVAPVKKHRGLSSRRRQLLLTDAPRLFYVDPDRLTVRGEVPWSEKMAVVVDSPFNFSVRMPGRTYVLEDLRGQAWQWKEAVDALLRAAEERDASNRATAESFAATMQDVIENQLPEGLPQPGSKGH